MKANSIKIIVLSIPFCFCSITYAEKVLTPNAVEPQDSSKIDGNDRISDIGITAKIKGLYISKKLFDGKDISVTDVKVDTSDGVVHLSGTVDNQEQANNAVKYAKSVEGVKKVVSSLRVKSAK